MRPLRYSDLFTKWNIPLPVGWNPSVTLRPPPQLGRPAVAVQPAGVKGFGLFATRDLPMTAFAFAERPLLLYDKPTSAFSTTDLLAWEANGRRTLARLSDKERQAFMSLSPRSADDPHPVYSKASINAYHAMDFGDHPDKSKAYSVIGNLASRINHSCYPNIIVRLSRMSLSLVCHVTRDIKKGEELFYSYTGGTTAMERAARLKRWHFVCGCPRCVNAAQTDPFGAESEARMKSLEEETLADSGFSEEILHRLVEFGEDCRKHYLDARVVEFMIQAYLGGIARKKGKRAQSLKHTNMAEQIRMLMDRLP